MSRIPQLLFLLLLLFTSCEKEAGEGGMATISGTVWVKNYNVEFTNLRGEYAGADEEVYIIYGNSLNVGSRIRSTHKGTFSFDYLRPGKYTVYVYSKDSTLKAISGSIAVVREVNISGKKQNIDLGKIVIFK